MAVVSLNAGDCLKNEMLRRELLAISPEWRRDPGKETVVTYVRGFRGKGVYLRSGEVDRSGVRVSGVARGE